MKKDFVTIRNGIPLLQNEIPQISLNAWRDGIVDGVQKHKGRIVALFAEPFGDVLRLYCLMGFDGQGAMSLASTNLQKTDPVYPSLTPDLPEAHWFERELFEQHQIRPDGHPWLKPIRCLDYPFFQVEGEEIHEVAVGPVHAGIIEPGHFRFQCHGEKVFHLEIQLGYQHRGLENLLPKVKPSRQAAIIESIAGDTCVGHSLAFVSAVEGLAERSVSSRAQELRAVALELERVANHIGDLGMISQDIGFLPAAAYFGRLRGEFLNLLMEMTGNRYGRSFLRPGGVLLDLERIQNFVKRITKAKQDFQEIADLFFSSTQVLARLEGTGVVTSETARALGLVGPVARASGINRDVRQDYPHPAHKTGSFPAVRLTTGDVYARAKVRSIETKQSLKFLKDQLPTLSEGKTFSPCDHLKGNCFVVSLVEGWRGEMAHVVMTDVSGKIRFVKIVDPSFHNWMGLQMAMREGQISDFPLCNKSFNLSYAGHDL